MHANDNKTSPVLHPTWASNQNKSAPITKTRLLMTVGVIKKILSAASLPDEYYDSSVEFPCGPRAGPGGSLSCPRAPYTPQHVSKGSQVTGPWIRSDADKARHPLITLYCFSRMIGVALAPLSHTRRRTNRVLFPKPQGINSSAAQPRHEMLRHIWIWVC